MGEAVVLYAARLLRRPAASPVDCLCLCGSVCAAAGFRCCCMNLNINEVLPSSVLLDSLRFPSSLIQAWDWHVRCSVAWRSCPWVVSGW